MRLYQFLSQNKISLDDERYDTMYICLDNLKTDKKKEYTTQELIDLLINDDVTYIKSHHLDLSKSKSVEFNKSKSINYSLFFVYNCILIINSLNFEFFLGPLLTIQEIS